MRLPEVVHVPIVRPALAADKQGDYPDDKDNERDMPEEIEEPKNRMEAVVHTMQLR